MSVTSNDVIDQEAVRAEVEEYAKSNQVFRRAFRSIDSTSIDSDSVEIPVLDKERAAGVVDEGTSYPSTGDATRKVRVDHDKYGVEVEITYEAIQDALLDVIALHTEERAEDLAEALDEAAYAEVQDNVQDEVIGSGELNEMSYHYIVDAMTALEVESYDPDLLIVSPQSKGDLMKSDEFTRASDMGDEVIGEGAFGEVAGVPVYVDDNGNIGDSEAVMFDTDKYGIESERESMTSQEYEEESENKRVVQVRTRMGWKAIRPDAAVKIEA